MRFKALIALILFVNAPYIFCQEIPLSISIIPSELLQNSNSVLRNKSISIEINDVDKITVKNKRKVTVLNKFGENHVSSLEAYDDNLKIKEQPAIVYNAFGKEIKKYKQKDFKDVSPFSSNDLFSDDRINYLNYTAISYLYTIVYKNGVVSNNIIFIQTWSPLGRTSQSVQEASFKIRNSKNTPLLNKKNNLDSIIVNSSNQFNVNFRASNIAAIKHENLSPRIWG